MKPRAALQYHAFTTKHDGLANRLLTAVSVSAAFDPATPPDTLPPRINRMALWDTGATGSAVTPSTVAALGLVAVGVVDVNHAGGTGKSNTYLVNIWLPNDVCIYGVLVHECSESAGSFGVLIGMDVISQGDFSITNTGGKTVLSFRVPSIALIDYVIEANRTKYAGTPRNAPCPCGSGKKYKVCHGITVQ